MSVVRSEYPRDGRKAVVGFRWNGGVGRSGTREVMRWAAAKGAQGAWAIEDKTIYNFNMLHKLRRMIRWGPWKKRFTNFADALIASFRELFFRWEGQRTGSQGEDGSGSMDTTTFPGPEVVLRGMFTRTRTMVLEPS